MRTLVIAEPGCTAEGDFDTMVRQIHAAADCGADVFKSQWTSDAEQMIARRKVPIDPYRKYYGWLQYPLAWHQELRAVAKERGLQYACSVYLPQDVKTIVPVVDMLKISSFEAHDEAMLQETDKIARVLISTGMSDDQWHHLWYGCDILHCVSCYPAPLAALNIRAIDFDDRRQRCTGLSDHSRHLLAGAVAVACGADVIETHFRLDECDPANPDYPVAFDPGEFACYIQNIRDAELMLGDGVKKIQDCERPLLAYRVTT